MSRLNDIIRHVAKLDPQLAQDLRRETDALADRRAFGLNFERHVPEAVELPGRPVRKNDKVRVLPPRGETPKKEHERLWRVDSITTTDGLREAALVALDDPDESCTATVEDLVVVAEFRDPIYPGLVSTGKVERGGDKPFHTVINAENYHALQALLFTHRGTVDAIYIDPPYNTGAKDWKYNNDYVESDDHYRHSKWLAFMERRLLLAKELLNQEDSVLIVTIDEKEQARLALLLEQSFPDASISMTTSVISPQGSARPGSFSRVEEYIFFVRLGRAEICRTGDDMLVDTEDQVDAPVWFSMIRSGTGARREDSRNLFYPIFVDESARRIVEVGEPLALGISRDTVPGRDGLTTIWPIRRDGSEGRWQLSAATCREYVQEGYVKVGGRNPAGSHAIMYVRTGDRQRILSGEILRDGEDDFGYPKFRRAGQSSSSRIPKSLWNRIAHDAGKQGSMLVSSMLGGRKFPFPKSLYGVEDSLRFVVRDKPQAVVLDFFAGSGTTAQAVMRLNKQDRGRRRSITVTNNEVSAAEQQQLRRSGFRPGEDAWESQGICEWITKPRLSAAITGRTPDGDPIPLNYKFTDEFPMADGFEENVEFFTLTYESAMRVSSNREFAKIAPFLWMRAGAKGRRIDALPEGWDVAETYGVIADLDRAEPFVEAIEAQDGVTHAFIVTDEDRLFEAMVRQLPEPIEPVRLYSTYLRNFEIEAGRASR